MPDKAGRFNQRERLFADAMAKVDDPTIAATVAGYSRPKTDGWRLLQNPAVAELTREVGRSFLREKAGPLSVYGLATIGMDEKQPAGARVSAFTALAKLSGIAITDGEAGKDLHEMDGAELAKYAAKLRAQAAAAEGRLADQAKPIIEGETVDNSPVTPSPFD